MSTHVGREGERLAANHLRCEGLTILTRNYRGGKGEIDLVAMEGETLVFVEVKLRGSRIEAMTAVDGDKVRRVASAAEAFLRAMELRPENVRFDLVAVDAATGAAEHIRDAFRP